MINPEIEKKYGVMFHGVLHMPVNVCNRCGEEDDPETTKHWPRDEDDDLYCFKCEQVRRRFHKLTIHNPATGDSSCACGQWTFEVRNHRPQWPLDPKDVAESVAGAYAAHLRITAKIEKRKQVA